jgi:hypothetical protein
LYTVIVLVVLVATGWGCSSGPEENLPTIQPTWETYENQEYGFAFQYPGKYTFKDKEIGDDLNYMGTEMVFLFSISDPTSVEGIEPILYGFFAPDMTLDQFKEITAAGYPGAEGAGQIVSEEVIRQGGMDLFVMQNSTAMAENIKSSYIEVSDDGLLIFSPFIYQEEHWDEMLPTLREIE